MKLTSHVARRTADVAITCTAILLPTIALASAGSAATNTALKAIMVGRGPYAMAIMP